MNTISDRVKMRREYLWQKGKAKAGMGLAAVFTLFGSVGCVLLLCALLVTVIWGYTNPAAILIGTLLFLFSFVVALIGMAVCIEESRKAEAIPYVPPIREQIVHLPAEEVLLRGSQATAAFQDDLLRPAATIQETPAEELLRVLP